MILCLSSQKFHLGCKMSCGVSSVMVKN